MSANRAPKVLQTVFFFLIFTCTLLFCALRMITCAHRSRSLYSLCAQVIILSAQGNEMHAQAAKQ